MIRINVVVEGQAEETFVHEVLARHLTNYRVVITPRRVEFSRKRGLIHRGGLLDYGKLRKDVVNWLNQDRSALVTTMVDLYALPEEFPGRSEAARIVNPYERVAYLETEFGRDINCPRFLPHIQLHEFESILFADIARLESYYPAYRDGVQNLLTEASSYTTPELINEGDTTAPSKRILREVPIYDKVTAGSILAIELTLPFIRARCPHFHDWALRLEALDPEPADR